jgi:hypothetical protein
LACILDAPFNAAAAAGLTAVNRRRPHALLFQIIGETMRGLWRVAPHLRVVAGLCAAALGASAPAAAEGSLTLSGLFDSDQGRSLDADVRWSPLPAWSVGAGVGNGESGLEDSALSGTGIRASTDLYLGGFDAGPVTAAVGGHQRPENQIAAGAGRLDVCQRRWCACAVR